MAEPGPETEPAIAVLVLLLLPRIFPEQNPQPPGVYSNVPIFSIDSYYLDPNDHFDEDLFEADPVLDQPSYFCGSRTGPWCNLKDFLKNSVALSC